MPAGITNVDGFAYTGREAWHGLGVKVEGEAMTAQQAIEAASLDWEIGTKEVYVRTNDDQLTTISGKRAIYRKDTEEVFNVMGARYTPVQNTEAFNLFDAVIGTGEAVYHTVGSLNRGRRVWILAKFQDDAKLDNGDKMEKYLLLSNTHDGTSALRMQFTPIRVVCQNTLSCALSGQTGGKFYFRHTLNVINKATEAREFLGLTNTYFERFMTQANELAQKEFDKKDMVALALKAYDADKKVEDLRGVASVSVDSMISLFSNGTGNKGETAWDAFNAVTEFSDHVRPMGRTMATLGQNDELTRDYRLDKTWFGDGQEMRQRAWDILNSENYKEILSEVAI
jgi:phage/plasmid-like protein (TIGR03299 family)